MPNFPADLAALPGTKIGAASPSYATNQQVSGPEFNTVTAALTDLLNYVISNIPSTTSGTSAPGGGTYTTGSIVWNTAPTPGGNAGWICTSGGTPGTWYAFGAISPS